MLDTLEVCFEAKDKFRPLFSEFYEAVRDRDGANLGRGRCRPSDHYEYTMDLRPEYPFLLHMVNKRDKVGNHKLQLVEAGALPFSRIVGELERIVDTDPLKMCSMRVDMCANVPGVPVDWFHSRARVAFAQWTAKVGKLHAPETLQEMGKREMQTLYFGKRPNCHRIYDKVAELRAKYTKERMRLIGGRPNVKRVEKELLQRRADAAYDAGQPVPVELDPEEVSELNTVYAERVAEWEQEASDFPGFEAWTRQQYPAGHDLHGVPDKTILTRVERQMGGGRVPYEFRSVGAIRKNAVEVNPFSRLVLDVGQPGICDVNVWMARPGARFDTYCMGMYLRSRILDEELGLKWARGFVEQHVKRQNVARTWERVRPFLPEEGDAVTAGVTVQHIYEQYRMSITRQLAA